MPTIQRNETIRLDDDCPEPGNALDRLERHEAEDLLAGDRPGES